MVEKKIKVAYILTPITFGGSEKVSMNFLRSVDRKRFDILPILLVRPWEDEPYFAREISLLGYVYNTVPVAIKTGGDPIRVLRVAWRLYSTLKQGSFDLVHTHGYFADICGLPIAKLLGIYNISTCHGFISTSLTLNIYNIIDKYALRLCNKIIAVSDAIREDLIGSGVDPIRLEVIQNSVNTSFEKMELLALRQRSRETLCIEQDEFVVGYIGRLSAEKGVEYLIEAVAELQAAAVFVKLLIIGDGPEKLTLEKLVMDKSLDDSVIFAGFQTDIEKWFPALDIFALPSLTEGTPMALLEAMAAGVPVIASAVGGVPKVVTDGVDGLLVPPRDSMAISEKINWLKENPEILKEFSKAGLDTINAHYSIDSWCRSIEKLYSNV